MSTALDFVWALSVYCVLPAIILFSLGTWIARRNSTRPKPE